MPKLNELQHRNQLQRLTQRAFLPVIRATARVTFLI
jgi:hypothetical protein